MNLVDEKANEQFFHNKEYIYKFFIKYVTLINDFLNYSINNQTNLEVNFFKNYIYNGFKSITNIFKITLLQSCNIDYTYEITQKSFIDYNEFIRQISDIDTSHINLTTTDAIVFIYKRSVFKDIEHIKNDIDIQYIMPILSELIDIHNALLIYYIENIHLYNYNFDIFTKNIYILIETFLTVNSVDNINNIIIVIKYVIINKYNFSKIINLLINFIKLINTKNINSSKLNNYLIKNNFSKYLDLDTIDTKQINKFFKDI
tara:strand:- start:9791 stop:10567 length:777 start_codon:yes stop_codon:yes gene_type:complete